MVGYHAFPDQVNGGFVGVDIFFVISGFLISGILFAGFESGGFTYSGFYERRIRRIFPALAIVLPACLVFGWFAFDAQDYEQLGRHVAAGAAFASNLLLWREAGYFDAAAETKPLLHLWSLGVEEQFYIFWPLLLGWAWRRKTSLLLLMGAAGALSLALGVYLTDTSAVAAFYSPLTRFWELMAGAMLAWAGRRTAGATPGLSVREANFVSALGLALIAPAVVLYSRHTPFPGWAALLPVLGAVLVIAGGPQAWCNRRLLAARPLVWVGLVSYPLYLWHWPLLVFSGHFAWPVAPEAVRAGAVTLSLLLAWLTYRWVERPVRAATFRWSRARNRAALALLCAAMLFLGGAGAWTDAREGLPMRAGNQRLAGLQQWHAQLRWTDADYFAPECHARYPESYYCMLEGKEPPTVALVGDSFANSLYYGLRDYYRARGQTLIQLGNGGCPPLLDIMSDPARQQGMNQCTERGNAYLLKLARDKRIGTILLAGNWHLYINGHRLIAGTGERTPWELRVKNRPDISDNPAAFSAAFDNTIRLLTEAGKKVVFIHQTPELDYRITACMPRPGPASGTCAVTRSKEEAYLNEYKPLIASLLRAHPRVAVVDPLDIFCDASLCHSTRDGVPLYRDSLHLSMEGSRHLGRGISLPE